MSFFSKRKLKSLRKKVEYLHNKREKGKSVDIKDEISAYKALANSYDKHKYDKSLPHPELHALECYRAAASLMDPEAQYIVAKRKMDRGIFWDKFSESMYGAPIHKTYAKRNYEEAFNYLKESDEHGYPLAKRLHGLAYINGWGVEPDKDKGSRLIVDSIDQEDAWDRSMQIFEELGLNKAEFFSTIMAIKNRKKS